MGASSGRGTSVRRWAAITGLACAAALALAPGPVAVAWTAAAVLVGLSVLLLRGGDEGEGAGESTSIPEPDAEVAPRGAPDARALADAIPALQAGSDARTSDARGNDIATIPLAPLREEDAPNEELRQAWEYYHTDRCQHPNAPGFATARSLNQIITYDAYNKAESFFTQPLQIVAGSDAGSKWMSDDLYERAASSDKKFHVVEGANHMSLYDIPQYVNEAVSVLTPFFKEKI